MSQYGATTYFKYLIRRFDRIRVAFSVLTLAAVFLLSYFGHFPDGYLHLKVFDVGQGDALFVRTPRGRTVLVDGGPDARISDLLSAELPFFSRTIDLVILTHPHSDHFNGLIDVLGRFEVRNIAFNESSVETKSYLKFLEAVLEEKKGGAKVVEVMKGDKITLDELVLTILWPEREAGKIQGLNPLDPGSDKININDLSIVSVLSYKNFDIFLPGDQQTDGVERMFDTAVPANVEVLKVAHHGSRNGVNERILEALRPKVGIISVGLKNRYSHPHQEALDLLNKFKVRVLRTDQDGTIEIVSKGEQYWVKRGH